MKNTKEHYNYCYYDRYDIFTVIKVVKFTILILLISVVSNFIIIKKYDNLKKDLKEKDTQIVSSDKCYRDLESEYSTYKYKSEERIELLEDRILDYRNQISNLEQSNNTLKQDNLYMRLKSEDNK